MGKKNKYSMNSDNNTIHELEIHCEKNKKCEKKRTHENERKNRSYKCKWKSRYSKKGDIKKESWFKYEVNEPKSIKSP